jgi:hypothetical protein
MKSFQLDPNSVGALLRSWPSCFFALLLSAGLAYVGWFHELARLTFVMFTGCYIGFAFRGYLFAQLQEKYPGTRSIGLLFSGFVILTLGVCIRMLFPEVQGSLYDIVWLGVSFVSIGWFVFINRKNPAIYE